jgi:hypothetical protein
LIYSFFCFLSSFTFSFFLGDKKITSFEPVLTQKHIAKPSETMYTFLSPRKKENVKEDKKQKKE